MQNIFEKIDNSESINQAIKKSDKNQSIIIKGWIHRKRSSGKKIFIILRDATGTIQCVADKNNLIEKEWNELDSAFIESSAVVTGIIKKDVRAPTGFELTVTSFNILSNNENQFPITEYQSTEFLLDVRHLWLRSQKMINIMKARSYIFKYAREFLDKNNFFEITPPLITQAGGETGANLFELNYFNQKAYLTESSQLYAEAMIFALERVYSFAPSYRAEKSRTTKHLAEYWHLEPEIAYFNNKQNMELQENLVSYIIQEFVKNNEDLLIFFNLDKNYLLNIKPPFKRISYEQAIENLNNKGADKKWGDDLGVEDEKLLTDDEQKPIFVYNWPKEIKAFYMPINPDDPRTVLCSDLQAPKGFGEIIGGSERIWNANELIERMKEKNLDLNKYSWYIDLRKYGSVPHAGFGMGIERVIKWILNLDHIRDAIPFPRLINRVTP
ncbi:MAG: asparagine--tRNA ligase [Candidatus Marsarchaeota archaeon]|nr:asparagine--tRNA ligase [Candidatus Marsarchaeota archaeon]MCL5094733.1 asparagine--tRNA ligase [Candidatus Marsarchaeota archaeon]